MAATASLSCFLASVKSAIQIARSPRWKRTVCERGKRCVSGPRRENARAGRSLSKRPTAAATWASGSFRRQRRRGRELPLRGDGPLQPLQRDAVGELRADVGLAGCCCESRERLGSQVEAREELWEAPRAVRVQEVVRADRGRRVRVDALCCPPLREGAGVVARPVLREPEVEVDEGRARMCDGEGLRRGKRGRGATQRSRCERRAASGLGTVQSEEKGGFPRPRLGRMVGRDRCECHHRRCRNRRDGGHNGIDLDASAHARRR